MTEDTKACMESAKGFIKQAKHADYNQMGCAALAVASVIVGLGYAILAELEAQQATREGLERVIKGTRK